MHAEIETACRQTSFTRAILLYMRVLWRFKDCRKNTTDGLVTERGYAHLLLRPALLRLKARVHVMASNAGRES